MGLYPGVFCKVGKDLEVSPSSNKIGVVMSGPRYGEKIFRGISCLIQHFSHRKWNDLIGFTMDNEFGDSDPFDFYQVVVVGGQERR